MLTFHEKQSPAIPFNILIIFIFSLLIIDTLKAQKKSETFEFAFRGTTLSGLVESPVGQEPTSLVIIVPGSGKTNFVIGNGYNDLRNYFVSLGLACCFWDKAGCGKSGGEFAQMEHPIEKSADEIIAAIDELKRQKRAGSERIGLWGISRAGWVCPWVIKKHPSIAFWISVSSPDDNDQSAYQLKSNLIAQGKSEREARLLTDEYWKGESVFVCGGSFDEYCAVTKNMRKDSFCAEQAGKTTREAYDYNRKIFLDFGFKVDCKTGKVDGNPGFKEAILTVKCPVLAIFGEKDSQVNWRNTIPFYKKTFGSEEGAQLTVKTFPNCNHNIQQCKTGTRGEDLSAFGWKACDGYYGVMTNWIKATVGKNN
jgi:uncharacterized protein